MEILTHKQKAENEKALRKALSRLKATVLRNRLLNDVVVHKIEARDRNNSKSVVLKTTGDLMLISYDYTPETDWADSKESTHSSSISLKYFANLGITPEHINGWRKRLE